MSYGGGIEIASSFTRKAGVPSDDSSVVADITARDALPDGIRFLGMETVVLDSDGAGTTKKYRLEGGITDSDWVEAGGGASLPVGGTIGQILIKQSSTDGDADWEDAPETSPLTDKGDIYTFTTEADKLAVGTDGQLLSANSAEATGLEWIDPPATSPLTTKGDLYTFDSDIERLAVGTDGQVLVADSSEPTGLKWEDPASGGGPASIELQGTGTHILSDDPALFDRVIQLSATLGNINIELPVCTTDTIGKRFTFKRIDAGFESNGYTVTIYSAGTDTIDDGDGQTLPNQGSRISFIGDSATSWMVL